MQNPFRDGGPLDRARPVMSLLLAIALLVSGMANHRNGASLLWPVVGALLVLWALYALYRDLLRHRRFGPGAGSR
ncbi:hypothetical protein [Peterkaempfera bronchialis]|uniref:Uncharacterized protein n=1 Tax=Peterkaempfera bronchialis TaxID=2126346 RepID=A0A345SWH2_9ACTN|nr:hypothetical protein [Peterkaempfera bronchialis]AXI78077.1 hypothetical protein C7M71_012110 [Peterkaempfera bronchialis]